jgi:hypothetical protein
MKAKLIFNLPEDAEEHSLAIRAGHMASTIWDLNMVSRNQLKYGIDEQRFKTPEDVFMWIRNELSETIDLIE